MLSRLLDAIPRDCATRDRARALSAVAHLAMRQRDYEEADRLIRESLALFGTLNETRGFAYAQTNLALLAVARARYADAEPLLVEGVRLARTLGDPNLLVVNLGHLAIVVHARGEPEKAASHFDEALTVARSIRNGFLASSVLTYKGRANCSDGNLELAEASLAESLTIADDLKDPVVTVWALERFAELAIPKQAPKRAATIWGAVARLREKIGIPIPLNEEADHKRALATTRIALGDGAFDQAWREGSAMEPEEAVRFTLNSRAAGNT